LGLSLLLGRAHLITVVLGEKKTHIELHDYGRQRALSTILIFITTLRNKHFSQRLERSVGRNGWRAAAVCGVLSNRRDHLHGDNLCFL